MFIKQHVKERFIMKTATFAKEFFLTRQVGCPTGIMCLLFIGPMQWAIREGWNEMFVSYRRESISEDSV